MAPSYTETVEQVTDQYLTSLTTVQNTVIDSISAVVGTLPKLGTSVPAIEVPAGLPNAEEIKAASFSVVEKLVANQKAFADKFLQAATV